MNVFKCDFLKILKKTVAIIFFITSSVSAMSSSKEELLQGELLSLRTIFKMEGLIEEERESLKQQIQDLENQLQVQTYSLTAISKLPTSATSSSTSRYSVNEELMRVRSMKNKEIEGENVDDEIKLLEAAVRAGIKNYRSMESLRKLVWLFSQDPPR